jgi:hypothetical protein
LPAIITSAFRGIINLTPGSNSEYVFEQSTPLDTWNIVHGLNYHPNVIVTDTNGNVVSGNVQYLSSTTIQVKFVIPFAGTAYLR